MMDPPPAYGAVGMDSKDESKREPTAPPLEEAGTPGGPTREYGQVQQAPQAYGHVDGSPQQQGPQVYSQQHPTQPYYGHQPPLPQSASQPHYAAQPYGQHQSQTYGQQVAQEQQEPLLEHKGPVPYSQSPPPYTPRNQPTYGQPQSGYPVQQTAVPQQPSHQVVVIQQPGVVTSVPIQVAPPTNPGVHMAISIINCLCCCCILGIIAIVFSGMAMSAHSSRNFMESRTRSRVAIGLNISGFVIGLIFWGLVVYAIAFT